MANNGLELFGRAYRLTVGPLDLSNLAFEFRVVSSLKSEPNTCDLQIHNLSDQHRQQLEDMQKAVVRLEVGYDPSGSDPQTHQIFLGETRTTFTEVQGPDRITHLASGDGEQAIQGSRVKVTFGPQVLVKTALQALQKALGVGAGNIDVIASKLQSKGLASIYPKGVALCGNAWKELQMLCRSCGVEVAIQDGALILLEQGQALSNSAVRLAKDSGLIGSPTFDNDGTVNCKALLIPKLRPGVKVQLESLSTGRAVFRVYHVEYTGDTWGNDWYANLAMQRVKNAVVSLQEIVI